MKHVFLVLNYNRYDETEKLINSLLILNVEYKVVIVDNGSQNESYKILRDKYSSKNNIHIVKIEKNLGFAKGNNIGYEYIKSNMKEVDFIHCINSDIIITDSEMLNKIENIYAKKSFWLLGPNILTNDTKSSPNSFFKNEKSFIKHIRKQYLLVKLYYFISIFAQKIMGNRLEEFYQKISSNSVRKKLQKSKELIPVLSGAYIIFSKDYIRKYKFLYEPITFLYSEEYILTYKMIKDGNKKIFYTEEFSVIHKHGASSSGNQKFKVECELNNLKEMKKYYLENSK